MASLRALRVAVGCLCLCLVLCASLPVGRAQSLFAFCATLSSDLSSSPLFPFAVTLSGTLNLSVAFDGHSPPTYLVQSAVGQRLVLYEGVQYSTSIARIAPVNSYQGNDNRLSLSAPLLSDGHGLAFDYSTATYSAYGPMGAHSYLYNDSAFGLAEDSSPPSDGGVASISSAFSLSPTSSYSATTPCPLPSLPTPSALQLSQLTSTVSYSWCYWFTGGPGDYDDDPQGDVWSISASGQLLVSQYQGSVRGVSAARILNVTGSRTYTDVYGRSATLAITGLSAVNNPLHGAYSDALLYAGYPYLDAYGLYFTSSGPLSSSTLSPAPNATLGQLFIDSYDMFDESITDLSTDSAYETPVGAFDLALTSDGPSSLQCQPTAGPVQSYAWCYSLQSTDPTLPSYLVQAFGVLTATGPVLRQGRQALSVQSMTGVRQLTTPSGTSTQSIVHLVYINGDAVVSNSSVLNDNLLYLQDPHIDGYGLEFSLSTPTVYPTATAASGDLNLAHGADGVWYEYPAPYTSPAGVGLGSTAGGLNFTGWDGVASPAFPCSVQAAPASYQLHFCYTQQSASDSLVASGTLWLYGAPMLVNGRSASAIQSASGTRRYQSSSGGGVDSVVPITGVSADAFGAVNFTYNQLLYLTAPLVDAQGLLFTLGPGALTSAGALVGDPVVNVALADGQVVERALAGGGGGVAGSALSVAVSFSVSTASVSCSVADSGGGGSSLSGGAIAGAVLGSVLGALLLLASALCALRLCHRKGGGGPASPTARTPSSSSSFERQRDPDADSSQTSAASSAVQLA